MTSQAQREQWAPADFGRAMAAYVEANAKHRRHVRRRGCACIESEAFYRKGADNPTSLLVNEELGSWADARAHASGNARDFARIVAGMDLVPFMEEWASKSTSPVKRRPLEGIDGERFAVEARDLWERCVDADTDVSVNAWLMKRGLDAARIVERDVARALPVTGTLPRWAACEGDWLRRGYRVVVPMFGDRGDIRSVHARKITPLRDTRDTKAAHPAGADARGCVMAEHRARALLAGDASVHAHVVSVSCRTNRPGVVVVEGVPAWLKWATDAGDEDDAAPAVFGVVSGSWTADIAARVPDGARVWVDVDHNDSGDAYASKIANTIGSRADIFRVKHTKAAA